MNKLLATAIMLSMAVCGSAQQRVSQRVISPVINTDGSVTFSFTAPNASQVVLSSQFAPNTPMTKDANGVWTVTLTPEVPDIYPYNFVVDGVSVCDPQNTMLFPNENFKASLLEMPAPDMLYTVRDVPHGKVQYSSYFSPVMGEYRPVIVYTPAEYDLNPQKAYPVFYLVSGTTDTEETWYKVGRANTILDNLIATGEAQPMIVVMPYGYMNMPTQMPSKVEAAEMYSKFDKELTEALMPYIESNYRTINDRKHRAIAGFSRGGGQSMFAAFNNPDKFAWLGSYSAFLTPEIIDKYFQNITDTANNLDMLYMCVGNEDFLYEPVIDNQRYFDEKGIKYQYTPRPGSHTWMHARHCLAESAKRLFRDVKVSDGVAIDNSMLDGYTVYRPAAMSEGVKYPVLVFGNGACSHDSGYYAPMLTHLVRNGYIVLAIGERSQAEAQSVRRDFTTIGRDDNLVDGIDWICRQSANPASPFYHHIDLDNIAVGGHSCGGAQSMAASYDPRVSTTIMFNSGMGDMQMAGASTQSLEQLHAPVLYLIGGPEDVAYPNAEIDFTRINHVPVAVANFAVGHGGTYGDERGGVLGDVALMWLDWQLKGDTTAARFFTNKAWRTKNYPQCDYKHKNIK